MNAVGIDQQPKRRRALAAGLDRTQKGVFDMDNAAVSMLGDAFAACCGWAFPPNPYKIVRTRRPKADVVPRKRQNAPDPALCQEATVVNKQPPTFGCGGCFVRVHRGRAILRSS